MPCSSTSSMRMARLDVLTQRRLRSAPEAAGGRYRFDTMYQPAAAFAAGRLETAMEVQAVPPFVDHSTAKTALDTASSLR